MYYRNNRYHFLVRFAVKQPIRTVLPSLITFFSVSYSDYCGIFVIPWSRIQPFRCEDLPSRQFHRLWKEAKTVGYSQIRIRKTVRCTKIPNYVLTPVQGDFYRGGVTVKANSHCQRTFSNNNAILDLRHFTLQKAV